MMPFLASFTYVALKAFQQLNVMHHRIGWVIPISYGMAVCEFFLVGFIAVSTIHATTELDKIVLIFQIGTGGAVGAIASMVLHKKMRKK